MDDLKPANRLDALTAVLALVRDLCAKRDVVLPDSSLEHDLKLRGCDADEFIARLAKKFGPWVEFWPWDEYLNLDEPPFSGLEFLAYLMPKSWRLTAFPALRPLKRLTIRHVAEALDRGEWVEQ